MGRSEWLPRRKNHRLHPGKKWRCPACGDEMMLTGAGAHRGSARCRVTAKARRLQQSGYSTVPGATAAALARAGVEVLVECTAIRTTREGLKKWKQAIVGEQWVRTPYPAAAAYVLDRNSGWLESREGRACAALGSASTRATVLRAMARDEELAWALLAGCCSAGMREFKTDPARAVAAAFQLGGVSAGFEALVSEARSSARRRGRGRAA